MNTNYKHKKRSYSTEFKRAYLTGLLPPSVVNNIPSSTLSSWRNKSLRNLYGYEFIYGNDEQLDFYQLKKRYESLIKVTKAVQRPRTFYNLVFGYPASLIIKSIHLSVI